MNGDAVPPAVPVTGTTSAAAPATRNFWVRRQCVCMEVAVCLCMQCVKVVSFRMQCAAAFSASIVLCDSAAFECCFPAFAAAGRRARSGSWCRAADGALVRKRATCSSRQCCD